MAALLLTAGNRTADVDDVRRRSLSRLTDRTCDPLDGAGQRPDTDLYDLLRSLTSRAVARWGSGDRAGALSGLSAARSFQVEHAVVVHHPSVRATDVSRAHDHLEHALLLEGSTGLGCTDARCVECSDGPHLQGRMILQVAEVPTSLLAPSRTSSPNVPARWLPPLGAQITLSTPTAHREPSDGASHHLDLEPAASMRQRLQQMARGHFEGATVAVALCGAEPASLTVEDLTGTVPRFVLLSVDG